MQLVVVHADALRLPALVAALGQMEAEEKRREAGWAKRRLRVSEAPSEATVPVGVEQQALAFESSRTDASTGGTKAGRRAPHSRTVRSAAEAVVRYGSGAVDNSPVVAVLECLQGKRAEFTQGFADELQLTHPRIDVKAELMQAQQWCKSNPQRRKTAHRARAFVCSWLSRATQSVDLGFAIAANQRRSNGFGQGGRYGERWTSTEVVPADDLAFDDLRS